MQRSVLLVCLSLFCALAFGCNADGRCIRNSDCSEGYSCKASACVADPVDAAADDAAADDAAADDAAADDAAAADAAADDA